MKLEIHHRLIGADTQIQMFPNDQMLLDVSIHTHTHVFLKTKTIHAFVCS